MHSGPLTITRAQAQRLGNLWEKGGLCRVYFEDLAKWYGLEMPKGRPDKARLDGKNIGESRAMQIMWETDGKLWWDDADGRFHWKNVTNGAAKRIVDRILEKLDDIEASDF